MHDTLRSIKAKIATGDRGFTLIELLVVVVIIGVLVAISIPVYLNYREGAANKSAQSDVRGALTAVEQFYTDNSNTYPDDVTSASPGASVTLTAAALASPVTQRVNLSDGTTLQYDNLVTSYRICAKNSGGPAVYIYNSASGGAVRRSTRATVALCITNGD